MECSLCGKVIYYITLVFVTEDVLYENDFFFFLVLVAMKTRLDFVGDCGFHCHQMVLEPMFLSVQPSSSKGGNLHQDLRVKKGE